jgi:hypothetical protein
MRQTMREQAGRFAILLLPSLLTGSLLRAQPARTARGSLTGKAAAGSCVPGKGFDGTVELVASPDTVSPGDSYAIQIFVRNSGRDRLLLKDVVLTTRIDRESQPPVSASLVAKDLAPSQRTLVAETKGLWPNANTWVLTAVVTDAAGRTCQNYAAFHKRN